MRKQTKILLCLGALTATLSASAMAKGFAKTQEYAGSFADVPSDAWFEKEVKNAYELGFVNGKTDTSFDPDGTMTVAEGITIASRVHASYNGTEIAETEGEKWYDMYVKYAVNNGIFEDGYFNNYDRTIRRYEMATLFAAAVPDDYLAAKNDITSIPDVDENEEYADTLLKLYRAGVVLGSDDYGNFLATNPVKRSEAAAIVNRTAIPENRLTGTLTPEPEKNEAYYLMDHYNLLYSTRGKGRLASSWNYENRCSVAVNTTGDTTNYLNDISKDSYVAINRDIKPQTSGNMTLKTKIAFTGAATDGARMYFTNLAGDNVFEIFTDNGVYNVKTLKTTAASSVKPGTVDAISVIADLDTGKGYYTVNEEKAGEFELGSFGELARIYFSTTKEDIISFTPNEVHMYMNYAVNENFFAVEYPHDWEKSENAVVETSKNDGYGTGVLRFNESGNAVKNFDELTDKTVFESYFLLPNGEDTLYVNLGDAVQIKVGGDKITAGDGFTHTFKNHIWQCLHVEADPATGKAVIFVNGNNRGTVSLGSSSFKSVSFEYDKKSTDGYVMIDDVKVYNVYDYADYCPVPQKAESDDYTLIMSVCSLWREGTHSGWDFAAPYDECSPLMGYYDEGIPETADWETKMMLEHGIDAFQYCWYAPSVRNYNEPFKTPGLAWSQHDGYFYSKYSDMIKYCFMWENQNFSSAKMTLEEFKTYIWDYWVEWYFRDDRYLTIDNKPVLHIYRTDNFLTTFGADEGKKVVEFMNEDIKKYGYDGIYLFWQTTGTSLSTLNSLKPLGGDGIMAYSYDKPSYNPDYLKDTCSTALSNIKSSNCGFALVPTVATGRNIMGWENARTPLSTVEQHRELLEYYKELIEEQNKFDIIYFSTWNEYGEGHWLAPSGLNGFGYADEWRAAFTDAAAVHDDVTPTINQKNRIAKLYNDNRTPIRAWFLDDYGVETQEVLTWDFENGATVEGWTYTRQSKPEVIDGAMHGVSTESDPIVRTPTGLGLDASKVDGIRMTVKSNVISGSTIYFITEQDQAWNAAKSASTTISQKDKWVEIYFDFTNVGGWTGTIDCLRFDVIDAVGIYDVKKIVLEGTVAADSKISVDGIELELQPAYMNVTDSEWYIVGDPDTGIFSANNFYYEWNRWNETLYVKTGTDTEFKFTVGKDTVLVNGTEKKLEKPFYTFDHMPVIPMRFILDNAGIEYQIDGSVLKIKMRGIDISEIKNSRIPFQYEFNIPGDMEGWTLNNVSGGVDGNGVLSTTAKPQSSGSTGYDPGIVYKDINLLAKNYVKCEIRMRYEFLPNATDEDGGTQLTGYFATSTDGSLNEAKTFRAKITDLTPDSDGFITVVLDLTTNDAWQGNVTTFRIDPTNNNGVYEFDYIRFIEGENVVDSNDTPTASTNTTSGKIVNGDAEGAEVTAFFSGNGTASIEEDNGSKVWSVKAKAGQNWTYLETKFSFVNGKKYKYSFDVKLVADSEGVAEGKTEVALNFRYPDSTATDGNGSQYDHNVVFTKLDVKDGWVHVEGEYVAANVEKGTKEQRVSFYSVPVVKEGVGYTSFSYMIDNLTVTEA